ncbi:uncharacterized protein LOC133203675 isoform X2 [Saccostrea echinata]|uniref:uncharacterized protein LOC133203675 isoform X2 n=1 Tax=Saccostrea echinata TaxID=191078 RepID=UPI002A81820C|nr:uncharacterized protein LOC133203675 isoform X2 [Saccostrea echinata]
MPGITDRVHFEDEVILRNIRLDQIGEERSQTYNQGIDDILNPNATYLTELLGPDELGEDFGFEPEDAHYVAPSESEEDYVEGLDDPMLDKIKGEIAKNLRREESETSESSSRTEDDTEQEELNIHYSEHFTSVPYGVLPKATYTHGRKNADIMGIVYNGRMRQFVILDGKGITTWKRDPGLNGESRIQRALMYPKYEYRLISYLVYAKKFNCYFALGKDFSLKVLNRDFIETCSVSANLRSVLFMLFNPVGDELITGGVGGTTIWKFEQDATKQLTEIKPLANYRLRRVRDLKDVGGSWVKRVDLDFTLQHLYCCSDTDLYAYDLKGQLLFKFLKAHSMSITGCIYSQFSKTLLTCSIDTEVKMWSLRGGLVHTFRGHSRAVTSLVVHPVKPSIIVTASLDGSVRMWSLNTMEILYSVVISTDGLLWMGMTDDCLMYCATVRNITLWNLNQFYDFFAVARSRICRLSLATCENKTTRVVAEGQDSSMRLFSRKSQKNMTTVLPPPDISPLQRVMSVCYSREYNMVFVLITTMEIWVYTTKTDPSCRVMTWNVHDLQMPYLSNKGKKDSDNPLGGWSSSLQGGPSHRATENGLGNETLSTCHSLCILTSTATMWTEEGFCCPIQNMDLEETYLLMGLEDGRILFMDPVTKGKKYMEFKASKDAIQEMRHDISHNALVTLCHLKELAMIQIWSLPKLELKHELYCSLDIICYARLGEGFMTGHQNGCVNFYTLEPAEDWGLFRAKIEPNKDSVVKKKRPEHHAEVVAIDSSASMRIFCSASLNGVIRIWDENKHLLTEIFMDKLEIDENIIQEEPGRKKIKVDEQGRKEKVEDEEEEGSSSSLLERSLSAACFLNNKGDLIIGYKNHIFSIDHTKVCPHLSITEEEEETDKESAIIEDPSVIYEGGVYLPEPVTLENYLVPFDFIDFSKDFLEGKMDHEESSESDEESGSESSLSLAPTEIYQSPLDSPWSRSMIDLTLDSEIDKYELRQRMNLTMEEINRRGGRRRRRKAISVLDGEDTPHASDQESGGEDMPKFDFPMFGNSPGPSPIPTPPSHPATPEVEEVVEEVEAPPQKPLDDNFVLKEVPEVEGTELVAQQQQVETKTDSSEEEEVIPDRRNKYRLDNIKLDVKGLMKSAKPVVKKAKPPRKTDPSPARSDHTHAKPEEQLLTPEELARKQAEEERRLERVKKQMLKDRKFPKRGNKPTRAELIAEQRRLEELKKEHPYGVAPQLSQQLNKKPPQEEKKEDVPIQELKEDYPLVEFDQPDLDSFQDELWNPRETGVSGTSLMGTKLDLPQIRRGAAGTPGPRIIKPPPTPISRGATPLPPENNGYLQVPTTPTPGSRLEVPLEIDKVPDEVRRELQSRQGRISPLKGLEEEEDQDNLIPDIETAVQRQWNVQNDLPERPRSETPTAALKKLSDSRKGAPKLIRVDLPKESDGKVDTYRSRLASPISEMTEDRSHFSGHEADDEMDRQRPRTHYKSRRERSLLTKEELKYIQQRPNSSFHRPKPSETQDDTVRPQTAHVRFQAELELILELPDNLEDLQNAFEDALERYNSIHGVSATDKNKLYRNDGNHFEENWQEREIERHMLLRMQKALRSKSAAQKRQVWEEQLEEKRQKLQQRDIDTQSAIGFSTRSETSFFALTQVERANTSMSYMPHLNTAKPTVQVPKRPKTAAANLQKQQTDKTALKVEKPFRYKIRQGGTDTPLSRPPSRQTSEPSLSPRMIDPRNPNSLRPPSTKSIPSKCTRYILVSKQKQKRAMPLPTPLEEQLLAERFPMMGEKMYRQHSDLVLKSRKPTYCVEYTPFVNQWA